jgi:hypothetical protein
MVGECLQPFHQGQQLHPAPPRNQRLDLHLAATRKGALAEHHRLVQRNDRRGPMRAWPSGSAWWHRPAGVTKVTGEGSHVVSGVGEFEDARNEEGNVGVKPAGNTGDLGVRYTVRQQYEGIDRAGVWMVLTPSEVNTSLKASPHETAARWSLVQRPVYVCPAARPAEVCEGRVPTLDPSPGLGVPARALQNFQCRPERPRARSMRKNPATGRTPDRRSSLSVL